MTSFYILRDIFLLSFRLGLTSFGGPAAHLGYFHDAYVTKRRWMDDETYADLVALSQFLPGPASSQVGMGIGIMRGGVLGGMASFIGFTLPSVLVLILFASIVHLTDVSQTGFIHGLKIVAVVVVAQAVLKMSQKLTPDVTRKMIALVALVITVLWQTAFTQIGVIILAAIGGFLLFRRDIKTNDYTMVKFPVSRRTGIIALSIFAGLLVALPLLSQITQAEWLIFIERFYRSGALVFGGGHVVLPLLEQAFVPLGLISEADFLAGYGVAQAVPGPLFTFAAYLGTVMKGWPGGIIATIAIFLPSFLLIVGALPFWDTLRRNPNIAGALKGVNAAVVGILLSALYQPIWTSAILRPVDFALAAILFSGLFYLKLPSWSIVLLGALGGTVSYFLF